jgi:acetoin utilization deacetylase AcuC-like enzyme
MSAPVVVHSPEYEVDIGPHVFPTAKYALVRRQLVTEGWLRDDEVRAPEAPSDDDLLRVHTPAYLDDLRHLRWTHRTQVSELPITREIVAAYILGAGGTTTAAREALSAGTAVHIGGGFHHAFADHAEGFCYINDLAVAIRTLQHEGRLQRAAVVDVDVHQGNGTAHLFENDPDVFTLSIHQEWNYPSPKMRSTRDVGLPDGVGDDEYLAALQQALEFVWAFAPELVLIQAGADPYRDDQLGGLALTMPGLERRDRAILEGCERHGIPSVVTFGGGYARRLVDTVEIHAQTCRAAFRTAGHHAAAR